MKRLVYLVRFLLTYYWRTTRLALEAVIFAGVFIGVIFDWRWAPYSYEYVVMARSIFLLIFGTLVTFRLSKVQYSGQLTVLLTRVSRQGFYLASVLATLVVVGFFTLLLDMYLVAAAQVELTVLFGLPTLAVSVFTVLLTVGLTHLFSVYLVPNMLTRLLAPVFVGICAMPDWYNNLPGEALWRMIAQVFPPIGRNIVGLLQQDVNVWMVGFAGVYGLLLVGIGIKLFERKSLTNLYF